MKSAFAAKSLDENNRRLSSSGGVFTELAIQTFAEGGVVFGAAFGKNPWEVRHVKVDSKSSLGLLRGAKYVRSQLGGVCADVAGALASGRSVLFSGTPCQVAHLKSFIGEAAAETDDLLTVEVVCHGVPQDGMLERYLKDGFGDLSGIAVSFRDKANGWKNYSVVVSHEGKREAQVWWQNPFMKGYVANLYISRQCEKCIHREGRSGADISLGDFWGCCGLVPGFDDDGGVSLVVLHSDRGREAFERIKCRCSVVPVEYGQAAKHNRAISENPTPHPKRNQFLHDLEHGICFNDAVDRALRPMWRRFMSMLKRKVGL